MGRNSADLPQRGPQRAGPGDQESPSGAGSHAHSVRRVRGAQTQAARRAAPRGPPPPVANVPPGPLSALDTAEQGKEQLLGQPDHDKREWIRNDSTSAAGHGDHRGDLPSCHCDKVAGVEVTLKSGPNSQKVLVRCFNPPNKVQCRFFAGATNQPLLEDHYAQLRTAVQKHGQSSPRELLRQIIQTGTTSTTS